MAGVILRFMEQQENDVLQSAEDWCKFYEDDTAWLQQKAKLEAQQLLETNEEFDRIENENAILRVQLNELKLVKKEPKVKNSEWNAIYRMRETMLKHPKMVRAFFDQEFVGKLEQIFETSRVIWISGFKTSQSRCTTQSIYPATKLRSSLRWISVRG